MPSMSEEREARTKDVETELHEREVLVEKKKRNGN
jgi:hypothetical protein